MSLMVSDNSLYLKNPETNEFLPVSIFNSGADKSMEKIAEFAEATKSEAEAVMTAKKTEISEGFREQLESQVNGVISEAKVSAEAAIEAKKNEVLGEIPDSYTELYGSVNQVKNDLADVNERFEVVIGKNLCDLLKLNPQNGYLMSDSGILTAGVYWAWSDKVFCEPNTRYIFSAGNALVHTVCYFTGDTLISRETINGASFITPENCNYIGFNLFASSHTEDDFTNAMNHAQLEKGALKTPYEPFSKKSVLKLDNFESGEEVKKLFDVSKSASVLNLYDKAIAADGKYFNKNNASVSSGTSIFSGYIPVEPNRQYCISTTEEYERKITSALYLFDRNGNYLRNIQNFTNTISLPFNTDSDVYFVAFNAYLSISHTTDEFDAFVSTLMLERGSCRGKWYMPYNVQSVIAHEKVYDSPILGMFDLSGKKWLSIGTSITWYNSNKYQAGVNTGKICRGYQSHVCKYSGIQLDNIGISGSTLSNVKANSLINRYNSIDFGNYDIVTIEYGVNDLGNNVSLDTFVNDYKTIVEHIITNYPKVKLIICTEPDVRGNNLNNNGNTLKDFADATIDIAKQYRLPLCDWYYSTGISGVTKGDTTKDWLTADGTHPNDDGHERMGKKLLHTMLFI